MGEQKVNYRLNNSAYRPEAPARSLEPHWVVEPQLSGDSPYPVVREGLLVGFRGRPLVRRARFRVR